MPTNTSHSYCSTRVTILERALNFSHSHCQAMRLRQTKLIPCLPEHKRRVGNLKLITGQSLLINVKSMNRNKMKKGSRVMKTHLGQVGRKKGSAG